MNLREGRMRGAGMRSPLESAEALGENRQRCPCYVSSSACDISFRRVCGALYFPLEAGRLSRKIYPGGAKFSRRPTILETGQPTFSESLVAYVLEVNISAGFLVSQA